MSGLNNNVYNLSWDIISDSGFKILNLSNQITTRYNYKDNLNGSFTYQVITQFSQSPSPSSLGYNTPSAVPGLSFQGNGTYTQTPQLSVTLQQITFT